MPFSLQSLLILSDKTLQGLNLNVYVLIKILKFCTGNFAKSYHCKFATGSVLKNRHVGDGELGEAIQEVIHHYTIRRRFTSVHPELRREGIVRVEVEEEGLRFVHEEELLRQEEEEGEEEEELLRQAISLSLEDRTEDKGEEELLMQAIALSLAD